MATFKIKHFKRVVLLNKIPIGYILTLLGTNDHIYTLWGGSFTSGYSLTDWGEAKSSFDVRDYEDGYTSSVLLSGITNTQTVKDLTNDEMNFAGVTLDINSVLVGVTPTSLDTGIVQTSSSQAGTFSISDEVYRNYARKKGWTLTAGASLSVVCVDPLVAVNFGTYPLIANYAEITFEPNNTEIDVTTAKVNSRVRWGDAGSALCQEIVVENPSENTAGYLDLIEMPGALMSLTALEDRLVAPKNDSIYEILFVGSPAIFASSITVPDNGSLASKGCKKIGKGSMFLVGNDDFYIYKSGGTLESVGKNIKRRFFGSNADYYITDLQNTVVQVFEDRQEIWMWIPTKQGVASSEVYKFKDGGWFMTDYYDYGHGNLAFLGKDFHSTKGWVPILFFDELNLTTDTSDTYSPKQKGTINSYRDLQSGVNNNIASFETKDFPLNLGSRITGWKFQVKCETIPYGNVVVQHSTDEGNTWSEEVTIKIPASPDLEWYSYFFDTTAESIRFKVQTAHDLSIGEHKLVLAERRRETVD